MHCPCSLNAEASTDSGEDSTTAGSATGSITNTGDQTCDFTGPVEFDED